MALDLSGVRRAVEKLLDDELQIWRITKSTGSGTLNEVTGTLTQNSDEHLLAWSGLGAVVRQGPLASVPPLSGAIASLPATTTYQALIPLSAPSAMPDDMLFVSRSMRDAALTGRKFRIAEVAIGTFSAVRVILLEPLQ
ncbi:DUF6093 family protein [Streptomyces sp. F001]|uniref:DUF6093 family protein n=1 Tax=Streptomyces sp. F001 TaxID=1510026 RepID=UPI00101E7631|nr:DUF6093 family protein [Streptomyces sp. F001]